MTGEELWRAVGEALLVQRTRRQWNASDVERIGGLTYKTVQKIEQGRAGRVDKLTAYADALGLSIVDVIESVLSQEREPLSPEAVQIVRKYAQTTVKGRTALVALAQALPVATEPELLDEPPDVVEE